MNELSLSHNNPSSESTTEQDETLEATKSFCRRTDWLAFITTTTLVLTGYLFSIAPNVTLGFSGIFSTSAMYGGVPHPPGYPLWTCYAWAFTKLVPFGNVAWRVALSSATATALACGLIAWLVSREGEVLFHQITSERKLSATVQAWTRVISGCVAGLVFGFGGSVWQRAVIPDVWPLTLLLLVSFLGLMRQWIHSPERKHFLFAAFLIYGAGLTNSHALLALGPAIPVLVLAGDRRLGRDFLLLFAILSVLPLIKFARTSSFLYASVRTNDLVFNMMILLAIAAASAAMFLIYKTRGAFTEWNPLLRASAAMLLGLSLYIYVPLASMTNPPMNWGYARTAGGFVHTLTRGQYEMIRPTQRPAQLGRQLRAYATTVAGDFGTVCLLPALLLPFVWRGLQKNGHAWLGALASVYLCLTVLLITVLNPATDLNGQSMTKVFYSLSYVVLSLWLGYGITVAVALFAKPSDSTGVPLP